MLIMRSNSSPATIPSLSASATWKHFQWNQYICLKGRIRSSGRPCTCGRTGPSPSRRWRGGGQPRSPCSEPWQRRATHRRRWPRRCCHQSWKEFLWLLAPPAESKLVGNQISRLDHGGELFHGNLAIVINIGFGEGSEEDVVELDVRVALCALHRSLHEHDKFILVFDIHGAKGD